MIHSLKFNGPDGKILDTLTFSAGVKKTLKDTLTKGVDQEGYKAELAAAVDAAFSQNGATIGFNSPTAAASIGLKASQEAASAPFKFNLSEGIKGAISDIPQADNISLSLSISATASLDLFTTQFGTWRLTGNWQSTWTPQSNKYSNSAGLAVTYEGTAPGNVKFEMKVGIGVESTITNGQSAVDAGITAQFGFRF